MCGVEWIPWPPHSQRMVRLSSGKASLPTTSREIQTKYDNRLIRVRRAPIARLSVRDRPICQRGIRTHDFIVPITEQDHRERDVHDEINQGAIRRRYDHTRARRDRVLPYDQHAPWRRRSAALDPDLAAGSRDREVHAVAAGRGRDRPGPWAGVLRRGTRQDPRSLTPLRPRPEAQVATTTWSLARSTSREAQASTTRRGAGDAPVVRGLARASRSMPVSRLLHHAPITRKHVMTNTLFPGGDLDALAMRDVRHRRTIRAPRFDRFSET